MILSGESAAFKLGEAKKGFLVMQHFKKILKCKSTFNLRECALYLSHNIKAWTRQLSKLMVQRIID